MALTGNEIMSNGFVKDSVTYALSLTTTTAGATVRNGFLRDADGRIVVMYV